MTTSRIRRGASPTQRTLATLREEGFLVAVVEHWNAHAGIRQDLFGIIDVLAVRAGTLAVQATSASNVSTRLAKLLASPALPCLQRAGWVVEVWGWHPQARHPRPLRRERLPAVTCRRCLCMCRQGL